MTLFRRGNLRVYWYGIFVPVPWWCCIRASKASDVYTHYFSWLRLRVHFRRPAHWPPPVPKPGHGRVVTIYGPSSGPPASPAPAAAE